jgi:hypothetical protein
MYLATGGVGISGYVAGRVNTGANTMYVAGYTYTSPTWSLILNRIVAGSATQLGSAATSFSNGDTRRVQLKMSGTTIEAWMDGSSVADISQTDSNITAAGKGGFRLNTNSTPSDSSHEQFDYWELNEADAGGQPARKRLGGVPFAAHNVGVW